MESAVESITVVLEACRQIAASQGLKSILSCVLASGNLLNSGTNRANAVGIKMENLLKLNDVRVGSHCPCAHFQPLFNVMMVTLCLYCNVLGDKAYPTESCRLWQIDCLQQATILSQENEQSMAKSLRVLESSYLRLSMQSKCSRLAIAITMCCLPRKTCSIGRSS